MNCRSSLSIVAVFVAGLFASVAVAQAPAVKPALAPVSVAPAAAVAAAPARTVREGVVAIVNDDLISSYDLRQQILWLAVINGIQPTQENLPQLQREALDNLIDQRLEAQELRHQQKLRKMTKDEFFIDDSEIDQNLALIAKQNNLTVDQFMQQMAARGISPATLRWRTKVEVSWQQYGESFYSRRVRITPDQIKAFQDQMIADAAQPRYLISEIFYDAARAGGVDAAVAAANQGLDQLQQGAQFQTLARQYSSRPTAANGGDAGWVTQGEVDPAVATALDAMRPGQMTRPIPVADGAYIILLREKAAAGGSPVVTLKQAAIALQATATEAEVAAAQARLVEIKAKSPTCATLETAANGVAGVEVGDLGEAELKDLSTAFRSAVENLQPDQLSDPVRTNIGLHLIEVCARRASAAFIPTADQVQNKLTGDQITMLQRRDLRNLRAAATISQPR